MTKLGIGKYTASARESITYTFTRNRPNLLVSIQLDGGEFRPVLDSFTFHTPESVGTVRTAVVMVTGADRDTCDMTISGETGPSDGDRLTVLDPVPVTAARYTFTVN